MPSIKLLLPEDMLDRIDKTRGHVPRLPWIRHAIERALADPNPPNVFIDEDPDRAPTVKPSSAKKRAAEMRKGADPFEPIMSEELAHAKNPLKPLMPKKCGHDSKYKTVSGNCIICEREG